jgi:hypothetical protein
MQMHAVILIEFAYFCRGGSLSGGGYDGGQLGHHCGNLVRHPYTVHFCFDIALTFTYN